MLEKYAYLCNMHKCEKCSYPECSHTTDERYRYISKEATEMRLVGSSNGIKYYMEFITKQGETQKISSTMLGREDHGIMTFMIYIDACGFNCGIG